MNHRDTIRTIASAVRLALGDMATPKKLAIASAVFARQCRELIAADGGYAGAIRDEVTARVTAIWPDPHLAEKVMTDGDPDHAYWLLVITDGQLRKWGARQIGPGGPGGMLAGIMGRVMFGPPPDEDTPG